MKRLSFLCVLFLLLTSCGRAQAQSAAQAAKDALQTYGAEDFFAADGDFIKTNFGEPDFLKEGVVYLSRANDGREFGFFELTDARYREEMLTLIRDYLASEEQSVRSLAALYPADDLQARLARFEQAAVGADGTLVYYCLVDRK
ncbi:MAG: hypothetical protein IKM08_04590 [Clostridia bacterium]|nr:hypothetical protein [Clostridia bacterium]